VVDKLLFGDIPNCAEIIVPITELTKNRASNNVEWGDRQEKAFWPPWTPCHRMKSTGAPQPSRDNNYNIQLNIPIVCAISTRYITVNFLGHIFQKNSVGPQVETACGSNLNTRRPKTKKECRSLLGLMNFYRRYPKFRWNYRPDNRADKESCSKQCWVGR